MGRNFNLLNTEREDYLCQVQVKVYEEIPILFCIVDNLSNETYQRESFFKLQLGHKYGWSFLYPYEGLFASTGVRFDWRFKTDSFQNCNFQNFWNGQGSRAIRTRTVDFLGKTDQTDSNQSDLSCFKDPTCIFVHWALSLTDIKIRQSAIFFDRKKRWLHVL